MGQCQALYSEGTKYLSTYAFVYCCIMHIWVFMIFTLYVSKIHEKYITVVKGKKKKNPNKL